VDSSLSFDECSSLSDRAVDSSLSFDCFGECSSLSRCAVDSSLRFDGFGGGG
jgi:hypothetical protein